MRSARFASGVIVAIAAICASGAARADRIDGDWCDGEGRRIEIQGNSITTPSGAKVTGQYGRHSFVYDAPAGDTPAGKVEFMQSHDDLMHERVEGKQGRPWKRCRTIS